MNNSLTHYPNRQEPLMLTLYHHLLCPMPNFTLQSKKQVQTISVAPCILTNSSAAQQLAMGAIYAVSRVLATGPVHLLQKSR